MLRTLFYIPTHIGGFPLFGYHGLLFFLWCLGAIVYLALEIKKHGWNREGFASVWFLLVVGLVLAFVLPTVAKPEGIPIRGYGTMLFIAIILATSLCLWRAVKRGYSPDTVISLIFWLFVLGIVGARIFYVVEYWPDFQGKLHQGDFVGLVNVADGGIVVYGSLIGGMIALFIFTHRHRLPVLATCDLLAPSMMLGLAVGRIGCLMNGCCFGGPCDLLWAVTFPPDSPPYESQVARGEMYGFRISGDPAKPAVVLGVEPDSDAAKAGLRKGDVIVNLSSFKIRSCGDVSYVLSWVTYPKEEAVVITTADDKEVSIPPVPIAERSRPVHPTQIYSSLNAFAILFLLLAAERFLHRDGELFCLMLIIYAPMRFILEIIRTDEAEALGTSLSISQNVSIAVILGVVFFWWFYIRKLPRREGLRVLGEGEGTN